MVKRLFIRRLFVYLSDNDASTDYVKISSVPAVIVIAAGFAADTARRRRRHPDDPAAESAPDPATQLKAAQKQLDNMKQLVSKATTDTQLSKLRLATDDLVASMEKLATDLQPEQDKLKAQLDVLGPPRWPTHCRKPRRWPSSATR